MSLNLGFVDSKNDKWCFLDAKIEESRTEMWYYHLFTWLSGRFTELFSILLSTYYSHDAYYLEWSHHLVIKARILRVILISFLFFMHYNQISKLWCFYLLYICWCLNSNPHHCYWTIIVIYIDFLVSSLCLLPVEHSCDPRGFVWIGKLILALK